MPYKNTTQTSGPKPHFTAVENVAQKGRVTQPRFVVSPHQNVFWDAFSLALKINLAPLAPELSMEPQLTAVLNFLSLFPSTCIYSLFFSVLDVAGCKAEHIALFASALCWWKNKHKGKRGEKGALSYIKGPEIPYGKSLCKWINVILKAYWIWERMISFPHGFQTA